MIAARYVSHHGSDLLVANAARASFGAEYDTFRAEADGPRTPRGRSDEALILDLARDGHLLPFRHPHITLACTAPLPVARQLGKHQVGFEWSEVSRRYKVGGLTFHYIDGTWRADVADRRQGSGDRLEALTQDRLRRLQARNIAACLRDYDEALVLGVAPEQARFLLPQSMNAVWTWTGSLLGWAHLYGQRTHKDAQAETRDFVCQVAALVSPLFPVAWRALTRGAQ